MIWAHMAVEPGLSVVSLTAWLNSSMTPPAATPPNWGSVGPIADCLPMYISLQEHAIMVPADMERCGTNAIMFVPKQARR